MNQQLDDQHARESGFHDQWAASTPLDQIAVEACFESPTALENKFILKQMGNLEGRHLLDVGCGLGEASVYFAMKGAVVTATDLSPGMIQTARILAASRGVKINTCISSGEILPFASDSFDVVYTANTIHHAADRMKFVKEIHRVLKPGGQFFSWDPLGYNPAIEVYRRIATEVRSVDESPLLLCKIREIERYFPDLQFRTFWLSSLVLFLKYFLIDRKNPNQHRYWKIIYQETARTLWWWKPLVWLDDYLGRIPIIQLLAWNVVLWGCKSHHRGS